MSHRMSVLSRRLGRFAVFFSVVTFCFLGVGFYAHANNKDQVMFFVAVLASGCFFTTVFLWLAHGFAWAMIPENPVAAKNTVESMAPEESAEVMPPLEALKPEVVLKPEVTVKPQEALKPQETLKRIEVKKPVEERKPAEEKKPVEEEAVMPDDSHAKYTITGRRIL